MKLRPREETNYLNWYYSDVMIVLFWLACADAHDIILQVLYEAEGATAFRSAVFLKRTTRTVTLSVVDLLRA